MIKIRISQAGKDIRTIDVKGHALSAEYGNDLVCAGVSSILFGAMNALDELTKNACEFEVGQNHIHIHIVQMNDSVDLLLRMLIIQLTTIEESYPENVQIKRKEV